jgi:hypothetical protein
MNFFSYKIEHDYGLAPNPFGQYCTLAVCKPTIRSNKKLKHGDWIIGTGSKQLNKLHHLIFLMQVEGKLTFNEYWSDLRFQYKKPIMNGSLVQMYGDNIYHKDVKSGKWIQEKSAHSIIDKDQHMENDLSGKFVLFSQKFYYFGDKAPLIPKEFWNVCNEGRNMKSTSIDISIGIEFIKWVKENFNEGINGEPINWNEYSQDHDQLKLKV